MEYDYLMKFIIIGDSGVGKSSILGQFMTGKFFNKYDVTIGIDFASKIIKS